MKTENFSPDPEIRCKDYKIGCVGSGFIMADVQLMAYDEAGFDVVAIASRTKSNAQKVADRWNIPNVYSSPEELFEDKSVEIVDIAFPPHLQLELVRQAVKQPHIKGILVQKPIAVHFQEAREMVKLCEDNGKVLSVNQNMRFDQSMRVLKQILDAGELGEIVIATIDMRAIPHWQAYLADYDRLTLLNMSVHHLDVMRYLFGEVDDIYVSARKDPRTEFKHTDGICTSVLNFKSGVMGVCIDDVWASPVADDFESDIYIKWRVEGTAGLAQGTIGWPDYPDGSPSTLSYCATATAGKWVTPKWESMWFPQAFKGVMEQLQYALKQKETPILSGDDNLKTMALIEAGYRSLKEKRAINPEDIENEQA
jgi:predicted dehydrogenase